MTSFWISTPASSFANEDEAFKTFSAELAPPELGLPMPSLELDFTLRCQLNPRVSVGKTPFGQRNWISFQGGGWVARWGRGSIVVGIETHSERLSFVHLLFG